MPVISSAGLKPHYRCEDGGRLLRGLSTRTMLVGTWAAADWAISFYLRHGFELVSTERKNALLKIYWTIPDRQVETSVVLESG